MTDTLEKVGVDEDLKAAVLPILPLKGTVVYPFLVVPLMIQEAQHTRLVDEALMRGSRIGLFLQKDADNDTPGPDDLYQIGTAGNILKMLRFPDGTVRFLIQGLERIKIKRFTTTTNHLEAEIEPVAEVIGNPVKLEAMQRNLVESVKKLVDLAPYLNEEFQLSAFSQDSPSKLADFVASNLNISAEKKQLVLEKLDVADRIEVLYQSVTKEIEVLELSQKIQAKAANELGKSQKDFILREQLKAIKKELGGGDETTEVEEFETKIEKAGMSDVAKQA
ncbi:MAG: LON peptidase substrate-binding domain-containing protein, partial [Candidatus Zixiibacteriota bacterium]